VDPPGLANSHDKERVDDDEKTVQPRNSARVAIEAIRDEKTLSLVPFPYEFRPTSSSLTGFVPARNGDHYP
jgi:hypothetical protein